MSGRGVTDVERDLGEALTVPRSEGGEDGHFVYDAQGEGGEVVGPRLGGGHDEKVLGGVEE